MYPIRWSKILRYKPCKVTKNRCASNTLSTVKQNTSKPVHCRLKNCTKHKVTYVHKVVFQMTKLLSVNTDKKNLPQIPFSTLKR